MQQNVWAFDIDGVITDPVLKIITNPQILKIFSARLISGGKIAFNTGRSAKWVNVNVIEPLTKLIIKNNKNSHPLKNLISVCEMGNVVITYGLDGSLNKTILNKNVIPTLLAKTLNDLVNTVYSESMFVDETKEVIFTIEMRDNYSHDLYKKRQEEFQKEISIIMKHYHPHLHVKPSSTTIAIDVKPIDSGKNLGAKRILEWCTNQESGGKVDNLMFTCIGDNLSDLDMSDYFYSQGVNVNFVYVGEEKKIGRKYPVFITENKYSEGTLEYLKTIKI